MENNWKEKINTIALQNGMAGEDLNIYFYDTILECMNLVFEATKKECADKADVNFKKPGYKEAINCYDSNESSQLAYVDKDSILNINKPNL